MAAEHRADVVLLIEGTDQAHGGGDLEVRIAAVELEARRLDDAARRLGVGVDGGAGDRAAPGAQSDFGVAKIWRTNGSKWESGFVG